MFEKVLYIIGGNKGGTKLIEVTLRITGEAERVQQLSKEQAMEFRLKFQFQMLLKGVYLKATDDSETQFRLVRNNEIIGYLYMTPVS